MWRGIAMTVRAAGLSGLSGCVSFCCNPQTATLILIAYHHQKAKYRWLPIIADSIFAAKKRTAGLQRKTRG
jgi:alkylation response protein AidB-like acyl-CoA dehydrogenase